jgi:hypothetical protein
MGQKKKNIEDTKGVIENRKIKEEQAMQLPRKRKKVQTMIYKSLHRKLKSVQHQPYQNP